MQRRYVGANNQTNIDPRARELGVGDGLTHRRRLRLGLIELVLRPIIQRLEVGSPFLAGLTFFGTRLTFLGILFRGDSAEQRRRSRQ